jgi:hypothetical protein
MRWGRPRAVAIGAALLVLAFAAAAAAASKPEQDRTARHLVRLGDLGPGYLVGDKGCGIGPTFEGASARLRRFNDRHRSYSGCGIDFGELWRPATVVSRPESVESVAIRFSGRADARAAFRIGPEFAGYNFGVGPRSLKRVGGVRTVGQESRLYRTDNALVGETPGRPALVVVWRTGRTLSLVLAGGKHDAGGREEALRLAEIQQRRVVKPAPVPPGANDDRFVWLDDPNVDVPINWLGTRFRAPGLPALAFEEGQVMRADDPGPGSAARIEYSTRRQKTRHAGVELDIWRPAAWERYTRSRAGRLVWAGRCTKATRISLPTGYATLFAGHVKRQKRCGRRPDRFLAHVFLPGTIVAVNMPLCAACVDRGRGRDPWDSMRGMRAIVTGLRIRAPR